MMKKRHHHPHGGGMLMLDTLAVHSGLYGVSPVVKTLWSVITLVLCVCASDMVVGIAVALSMTALMILLGKVSPGQLLALLRIPLAFLTVSCLVILLELRHTPEGLWTLSLGNTFLCITPFSLHRSVTLFFQSLGAVCCLYFLSTSTPMPQIIEVLRRCHMPELVMELMFLIYRYLFVLLDAQQKLTVSAASRLGDRGFCRSVKTAGRVSGSLLAASFRRSSQCFDAMESRGYQGKLRFLSHMPPLRGVHCLWALLYVLAVCILTLHRKGAFSLA